MTQASERIPAPTAMVFYCPYCGSADLKLEHCANCGHYITREDHVCVVANYDHGERVVARHIANRPWRNGK
jgi:predicted RNA-binding Zn-ribbon protein involved in translation (DUF1610 family)